MWFKDFQEGCHGGYLWYQNETILAILNPHVAPMPSTKFLLNRNYRLGGADNKWKIFKMATVSHLGYRNKMILALQNLHAAKTPPTKFWIIPTYHFEGWAQD